MVGKDGYLRLGQRFANAATILLHGKKPKGPVFEATDTGSRTEGVAPKAH